MEDLRPYLREIPKMDELLEAPAVRALKEDWGQEICRRNLQELLEDLRCRLFDGDETALADIRKERIFEALEEKLDAARRTRLSPVWNGSGILLHTNLGRSPLGNELAGKVADIASGYCNLEYRLPEGKRGSRHDLVEEQLCYLTGAEAAMVVNNNAAAVLLMLAALAPGREVIVSRGELVEIGGAFRVPDVMQLGGAILREVGTTNKTRLSDYEGAIGEETAALLKVHTSNFLIQGFTESVSLEELRALADQSGLPLICDLGSGLLHPDPPACLLGEPSVHQAVAAGCDLISFSGDKLLGGPQAGIIVGKRELIECLKTHQLARALRVDKLCLAALSAILEIYQDPERINREIPIYQMLSESSESLEQKADLLCDQLDLDGIEARTVSCVGQVGGGSAPGVTFPSAGIALKTETPEKLLALEKALRLGDPHIISYIRDNELILDLRCLKNEDLKELPRAISRAAWEI